MATEDTDCEYCEYDDLLSIASGQSPPAISLTEGKSEATSSRSSKSRTEKTSSRELSFPEILDKLEQAVEEADRKGGEPSSRGKPHVEFSDIVKLMGEQTSGRESDVSETLGVLELFENFEKDIAAQKSQITKLQCEMTNLSMELDESRLRERKGDAKHLQAVKAFENQISMLETNFQVVESERNELKTKEAQQLQKLAKLENQVRALQRTVQSDPSVIHAAKATNKMKDAANVEANEQDKKRKEYLEARVAELGNKVKEYEDKEKLRLAQKSDDDFSNNKANISANGELASKLASLEEEIATAKAKELEFLKEKGLAEFRIRELQQELMLSRPAHKQETGAGNPKSLEEINSLKNQVATLKVNLKNAESGRGNYQQKEIESQKTIRKLQNQVRTLQRILYNKDPTNLPSASNPAIPKGKKDESLEAESERLKFLEGRIIELENQLKVQTEPEAFGTHDGDVDKDENTRASGKLISELRQRLISQMQLVTFLKQNLITTKSKEAEWLKEKELFEFRIRELNEELAMAKSLGKPENQILADLSETVQSLHSRYFYREKELDHLIRRLSLKSLTSSCLTPTRLPFIPVSNSITSTDIYSTSNVPLPLLLGSEHQTNVLANNDDGGLLSPNTAVQLLRGSMDEFLLLN